MCEVVNNVPRCIKLQQLPTAIKYHDRLLWFTVQKNTHVQACYDLNKPTLPSNEG